MQRKQFLSIYLKLMLIKTKLLSILTYSGELWGMNSEVPGRPQKVLDNVTIAAATAPRTTSLRSLQQELRIQSNAVIAAIIQTQAM